MLQANIFPNRLTQAFGVRKLYLIKESHSGRHLMWQQHMFMFFVIILIPNRMVRQLYIWISQFVVFHTNHKLLIEQLIIPSVEIVAQ